MKPAAIFALIAAQMFAQTGSRMHVLHKEKLGDEFECSLCHVPAQSRAAAMPRPGHEQCMTCHSDSFTRNVTPAICRECHTAFPPAGRSDLLPFPRHNGVGAIVFGFSHARHMDRKARVDAKTGLRADCTFCHRADLDGAAMKIPAHEECAACHAKAGTDPETCRTCHKPETTEALQVSQAQRRYEKIAFSHASHSATNCTVCHYAIPASAGTQSLSLPKMTDCVTCHDAPRTVRAEYRMSNCKGCHRDDTHVVNVKPAFHTDAFRLHHEAEAAAPNAKCFACHQNVRPALPFQNGQAKMQCGGCHEAMRPASHTARWKDDLHGKYAAMDRTTCATCHTAAYCSDCHNELPRSHQPLAFFKGGAHAFSATLNLRSCFTCHTFQNTCSECHVNSLGH